MRFLALVLLSIGAAYGQPLETGYPDFKKADSIAALHDADEIQNLPVLVHGLTDGLPSETEKFRAIYTWVSTHIKNDYSGYEKTVRKRQKLSDRQDEYLKWNNDYLPKVFRKLLKEQETACTGYAYLVQEMAKLAGIECRMIHGYGRTSTTRLNQKSIPNHSWNAVKLKGKWQLCDATWSAGRVLLNDDGPAFQFDYSDGYFLAPPALFVKNHYPEDPQWLLMGNPLSFEAFLEGPLIYKGAFQKKMMVLKPTSMNLEIQVGDSLSFSLLSYEPNDGLITLKLNNGSAKNETRPEVYVENNVHSFTYAFDRKGLYDVHILVGDDMVATYVVNVKRSS